MSTNTLTIDLNEEYKIKIEDADKLSSSYFKEIYERAGKAAEDILTKSNRSEKSVEQKLFARQKEEYNNIIAFCGERGTGKSSAMITFAQSLVQIKKTEEDFYNDSLCDYSFHYIDVIDPSMFEDNEHIFEVILSQMFSCFTKELEENRRNDSDKRRKILELFQKVYESLKTVQKNGDKYNGEALETLSKLACGANLRSNFSDLVQEYLEFIKPAKDSKPCLIIPIDDFDLNVKAVAVMTEQIRKYLMIPNVIILMAADMNQLADAKEQSVRDDFETLIDADGMTESPKAITSKYILKLIPDQRRLLLPFVQEKEAKIILKNNEKQINQEGESIQDLFLRLCYQNYQILFIKPRTGIHNLIPGNIRELKEWLIFLANPPKTNVLKSFNDKFIRAYCGNYLEKEEDLKLIKLIDNTSSNELNKRIIQGVIQLFRNDKYSINEEYKFIIGNDGEKTLKEIHKRNVGKDGQVIDWKSEDEKRISYIIDFVEVVKRGNYPFNISLGDLLFFLNTVNRYYRSERIQKIIFALKTLVSLRLKRGIINKCIDNSEFNSIVGGSIINNTEIAILTNNRDSYQIKYADLQIDDVKINDILKTDYYSEKTKSTVLKLECLHYFISKIGDENIHYRSKVSEKFYSIKLNKSGKRQQYATFDLFAPLFYIVNPEIVFERVYNLYKNKDNVGDLLKDSISNLVKEKQKNIVFPFESVELINYVFNAPEKDYGISNIIDYYQKPFENILERFSKISDTHRFYINQSESYLKDNPIFEMMFDTSFGEKNSISTASTNYKLVQKFINSIELYVDDKYKVEKSDSEQHNELNEEVAKIYKTLQNIVNNKSISISDIPVEVDSITHENKETLVDEIKEISDKYDYIAELSNSEESQEKPEAEILAEDLNEIKDIIRAWMKDNNISDE